MIEDFLKSQVNPYDIKEVEHENEEKTVINITLSPMKTPGKKNNYISYQYPNISFNKNNVINIMNKGKEKYNYDSEVIIIDLRQYAQINMLTFRQ